ncbi:hypothetical protein GCM10027615_41160 [Plantactinospora veratri]
MVLSGPAHPADPRPQTVPEPATAGVGRPAGTLAEEQARLAAVRAALARMLTTARVRVATGATVAGDRYTAETLGRMLKSHLKELTEEPDGPVYFGRLWFGDSAAAGEHRGECYYLGRRHVPDESGQPLVIDWRAPVSRAFYRASAREPLGVRERRRYGWTNRQPAELTGYEDERLERAGAGGWPGAEPGAGPSRLLTAEIERPRVGPMRDIVATIQPDQDDLVRADLDRSVCVQGGPGTGKTAVGLHRAAYLLYTHRQRLRRGGVLVVGPNVAFLRYISAVLPALGEVDVEQCTLAELLPEHPVTAVDSAETAALKHDPRMVTVLRRALYDRIVEPTEPLVVPDGSYRWRLPVAWLRRTVQDVRAEEPPYAIGRERLRARIVGLLQAGPRPGRRRPAAPGCVGWPGAARSPRSSTRSGRPPGRRNCWRRCSATRPCWPGRRPGCSRPPSSPHWPGPGRPGRSGPRPGPRPTWFSSTSWPGCSTIRPATGTSWWTRRRTSRRWSAGSSPGAAGTAR